MTLLQQSQYFVFFRYNGVRSHDSQVKNNRLWIVNDEMPVVKGYKYMSVICGDIVA